MPVWCLLSTVSNRLKISAIDEEFEDFCIDEDCEVFVNKIIGVHFIHSCGNAGNNVLYSTVYTMENQGDTFYIRPKLAVAEVFL